LEQRAAVQENPARAAAHRTLPLLIDDFLAH
jgi:hypothetical protein